jgi:hypothetical protein
VVHFVSALKSGPFCVSEFNVHDKGDCQIKNAVVFSHSRNGGCTCAVIAVDSTGI